MTGRAIADAVASALSEGADLPTARSVPCRECGQATQLGGVAILAWQSCNRILRARDEVELRADEVTICERGDCRGADQARRKADSNRHDDELADMLRRVGDGETVNVSRDMLINRPSDYERVKQAGVAYRRRQDDKKTSARQKERGES